MSSFRQMNGGHALAEMLKCHDPAPMFGMAGFQLLPFYDAVRELGLSHTLINDERCGVFAADAWARVTGRPGICDATLGPGATNLVTGLVESLNAGVPLVVIVGNSNRAHSWKNIDARGTSIGNSRPIGQGVNPDRRWATHPRTGTTRLRNRHLRATGSRRSGCPRRYSTRRV